MDERMAKRRVYGADHDDPDPGPQPGREYRGRCGGPLEGLLVEVTGWTGDELAAGVLLITEIGVYGPGGRASYGPRAGDPRMWDWEGDSP